MQPKRLVKYVGPDRLDILRDGYVRFIPVLDLQVHSQQRHGLEPLANHEDSNPRLLDTLAQFCDEKQSNFPEISKDYLLQSAWRKIMRFACGEMHIHHGMQDKLLNKAQQIFFESHQNMATKYLESIGAFCATEVPDSLAMWRTYAQDAQGLVIEFDPNSNFFHRAFPENEQIGVLQQVQYDKAFFQQQSFTHDLRQYFLNEEMYEYEKEWRMLVSLANAHKVEHARDESIHLFEVPKEAITSVTLGFRMPLYKKRECQEVIQSCPELGHVRLRQALQDGTSYEISSTQKVL